MLQFQFRCNDRHNITLAKPLPHHWQPGHPAHPGYLFTQNTIVILSVVIIYIIYHMGIVIQVRHTFSATRLGEHPTVSCIPRMLFRECGTEANPSMQSQRSLFQFYVTHIAYGESG